MSKFIYEQVTAKIIKELEAGALPWLKEWKGKPLINHNIISNKSYNGINRILLGLDSMVKGYTSAAWGTYKQWKQLGFQVNKGEKASHIVFYSKVEKTAINENELTIENKSFYLMKGYSVFNANQTNYIEAPASEQSFNSLENAENTILKSNVTIKHGGNEAFYNSTNDFIQLPNKAAFNSEASYYGTAFHELIHSTGHKSRLNRELGNKFGTEAYAFEELIAELGASFLCNDHGIQGELRHAGYIASWLKVLKNDHKAIFTAAAMAQKAADFINNREALQKAA